MSTPLKWLNGSEKTKNSESGFVSSRYTGCAFLTFPIARTRGQGITSGGRSAPTWQKCRPVRLKDQRDLEPITTSGRHYRRVNCLGTRPVKGTSVEGIPGPEKRRISTDWWDSVRKLHQRPTTSKWWCGPHPSRSEGSRRWIREDPALTRIGRNDRQLLKGIAIESLPFSGHNCNFQSRPVTGRARTTFSLFPAQLYFNHHSRIHLLMLLLLLVSGKS